MKTPILFFGLILTLFGASSAKGHVCVAERYEKKSSVGRYTFNPNIYTGASDPYVCWTLSELLGILCWNPPTRRMDLIAFGPYASSVIGTSTLQFGEQDRVPSQFKIGVSAQYVDNAPNVTLEVSCR